MIFYKYGISGIEEVKNGALQFVLSNGHVNTICYLFQNFNDVQKYISLSGTRLELKTETILNDYKNMFGPLQCRIGCNLCESTCPHHIPVNTIMRYNYYFTVKREEKSGMQKFRDLQGGKPDLCADCKGFCEKACPYGVLTRPLLTLAHQNLSIDSGYYS